MSVAHVVRYTVWHLDTGNLIGGVQHFANWCLTSSTGPL